MFSPEEVGKIRALMIDAADRLESRAQNEEMIDENFTQHGDDCVRAARTIRVIADHLCSIEGSNA